ncbi:MULTISPECIES: peptidylprolyl isomerase [unclassified Paenibacillus]|uniref:peptidylprolyl isomerase n=1 Tax=unclassified Paenibacillus TaxID=185978 RepID=UPI003625E8FD
MGTSIIGILLILATSLHFISTGDNSSVTHNSNVVEQKMEITKSESAKEVVIEKKYTSPPAMIIDSNKSYQALVKTNKGDITIELFANTAPKTVNNFVFLSKEGFYNDIVFHRIIKSFMVQTGDPNGNGTGGPGYKFEDELSSTYKYEPGIVAMANAGPNTNGSQFFICTGEDSKSLDQYPNYTIFGKVTAGMDTVLKIADTKVEKANNTGELSHPSEKVFMESITVTEK